MVIQVNLVADDPDAGETTVASTIQINTADPRWPTWLVDAVTSQAQADARRLRDRVIERHAVAAESAVALATVAPAVESGR